MPSRIVALMPGVSADEIISAIIPKGEDIATQFYAEELAQGAIIHSRIYSDGRLADHLAEPNPHNITPEMIGAVKFATPLENHNVITLNSEWSFYNEAKYPIRAVRFGNLVFLSGLISRLNGTSSTIGQLHSSVRPKTPEIAVCHGVVGGIQHNFRVDIQVNGSVEIPSQNLSAVINWLSLGGVLYLAA